MPNHTFSYHKIDNGVDFFGSNFYADRQINAIDDPEGGNAQKLPTSIPSPFAIIDLTTTAFEKLAEIDNLEGHKVYEKIVSQCWDIGVLFFNAQGLRDRIEIIKWEREEHINELKSSYSEGHRILGETLEMYLNDDADAYNFSDWNNVFLIKYNHNFFGGTSPKTLFFCSLNPLEEDVENHINLGDDDILFDQKYCPLYKRSEEFQLFIYQYVKYHDFHAAMNGKLSFASRCKELNEYLEKNKLILKSRNRALFERIEQSTHEDYQAYLPINTGKEGSYVSVLANPLKGKAPKTDGNSDFKIRSSKYQSKTPLVLFPNFGGQNLFGQTMNYFDNLYSKEIDECIPFYHFEQDIDLRDLPGMTGIKYPYLLVDDFLEDTLFKVSNRLNSDEFYTSNYENEDYGFLCPIKQEFFKYFDVEELIHGVSDDGRPMFQLEDRSGSSIVATLRVPVNRGYITFTKTYLNPEDGNPDRDKNLGTIKSITIDLNIFPFIKYDPSKELGYVEGEKNEFRTHWIYNGFSELPVISYLTNSHKKLEVSSSKLKGDIMELGYQVQMTKSYYDLISLKIKSKEAVIIPKWVERKAPSNDFHFAIDFGTTNTHIEYKKGTDGLAEPLEITENVFGRLSADAMTFQEASYKEFIPEKIDQSLDFRFHQRSAIAASKSLDYRQPTLSLGDLRIPFYYEVNSHSHLATSDYHTNLKWSQFVDQRAEESRVRAFLEQLILMIKAKVIADGGKIKSTRFTWFYPSSMVRARIMKLEKVWIELLQKHFYIAATNINKLNESIAPFAYYMMKERVDSLEFPAVTIDIGGGTSDVVIFKDDVPRYISSFRYAANSIFGDGYNSSPKDNGFLLTYSERIKDLLNANRLYDLIGAYDSITGKNANSSDIIAFFMSLENNVDINKGDFKISFQNELANDGKLMIVLLLFYHALIFHIASLLKSKEMDVPGIIVFSGNGGNLIKIIDDSIDHQLLSDFTTIIFEHVYGEKLNRKVELKLNKTPKAVTCKGGLYFNNDFNVDPATISEILVGCETEPLILPTYPQLKEEKKLLRDAVAANAIKCINLFFELNQKFNYNTNFSIDAGALNLARTYLTQDGKTIKWLLKGLDMKMKELKDNVNVEIEETLFFYPFVGLLNELAYKLFKGR